MKRFKTEDFLLTKNIYFALLSSTNRTRLKGKGTLFGKFTASANLHHYWENSIAKLFYLVYKNKKRFV